MLLEELIPLLLAAVLGVHLVLGLVLLPLASHARDWMADAFFREILPRVLLLGLCVGGLAAACVLLQGRPQPGLLLSCLLFVALGNGLARHMLQVRSVLGQAREAPSAILRPLQMLNSAQLAVATVSIVVQ